MRPGAQPYPQVMTQVSDPLDGMVRALIPSLSRSLEEQFSIFRVMRHGTHEKQISNVFAWLLRPDASHKLGGTFQQIFIEQINRNLEDGDELATGGWQVRQEVDTSLAEEPGKDIADIVLSSGTATLVVENFATSDGHGHDYRRYLAYGSGDGRRSVVVLLCERRIPHLQTKGWEQAVVVTYAELIEALMSHTELSATWRKRHPQQSFFLDEMARHFVEDPMDTSEDDRIAFITTMCQTGEAVRFGHRPIDAAAREFADLLARHGQKQFEDARVLLQQVKSQLRLFATRTLLDQLNSRLEHGCIESVAANYQGRWEWCIILRRADSMPTVFLEFGPSASMHHLEVSPPATPPDFGRLFVATRGTGEEMPGQPDTFVQSDVSLSEVLSGLGPDDTRLRDQILTIVAS